MEETIRYLNTDLELRASFDLTRMREIMERRQQDGICLMEHPPGEWFANFETLGHDAPDEAIGHMLEVVESLDNEALDIWRRCNSRGINIGYESGFSPPWFQHFISPATLGRLAKADIGLTVTIYKVTPREGSTPQEDAEKTE